MSVSYERMRARLDAGDVVVMDGAVGTELQRRGAPMDPEAWCAPATLEREHVLTTIHLDYLRAGADVLTANTFSASRLLLGPAGLGSKVREIARRAVEAALRAREAAATDRNVVVAGSLSHMIPVAAGTGDVDVARVPSHGECLEAFHELAQALRETGADLLILEMMYHPVRARLALDAALATGLPVWFGLSARRGRDGQPVSFHRGDDIPLREIVNLIPATGVDVAGVMHTPADLIGEADAIVAAGVPGPRMAYPDSGHFEMPDWVFRDVISPDRLERFYRDWIAGGVQLVGGCCGLTVEHIEAAERARATGSLPAG